MTRDVKSIIGRKSTTPFLSNPRVAPDDRNERVLHRTHPPLRRRSVPVWKPRTRNRLAFADELHGETTNDGSTIFAPSHAHHVRGTRKMSACLKTCVRLLWPYGRG